MGSQYPEMLKKGMSPVRDEVMSALSTRASPVPAGSPIDSPLFRRAAVSLLLGVPSSDTSVNDSVASWSMDEEEYCSSRGSPPMNLRGVSPEHKRHGSRKQYKNELWAAIKPDYMYLMDEDIIDACKSTESDISSDELSMETKVSYNEFLQQYKELTDWLGYLQVAVSRQTASRSESYLNQMYHEEMLKQSPRQQLLKDYAIELLRRYPQLKQEIQLRLTHVSEQWCEVMDQLVLPSGGGQPDFTIILKDIEEDVKSLRQWVHTAEKTMSSFCLSTKWSVADIQAKLVQHQVVQKDIESRSRVVSAVMKLCEWVNKVDDIDGNLKAECRQLHGDAAGLEQRWHGIWIQSVEWQVRLEDALAGNYGNHTRRQYFSDEDLQFSSLNYQQNACETSDANGSYFRDSEHDYDGNVEFDLGPESDVERSRNIQGVERDGILLELECQRNESRQSKSFHDISVVPEDFDVEDEDDLLKVKHISGGVHDLFDIGYSSESYSYDEQDAVYNKVDIVKIQPVQSVSCVDDAVCEVSEPTEVLPVGRQSATSAYNSASDLSDSHRPSGLRGKILSNNYNSAMLGRSNSAATSSVERYHEVPFAADDCCTDDDFSKLKELSFDDIPLMFMDDESPGGSHDSDTLPRRHNGRSLDSLLPCDSDKMFKLDKRVSSVEVIIDSSHFGLCEMPPANVCGEIHLKNTSSLKVARPASASSSMCDASSEESEFSESTVSEDDNSPRKYKLARRRKRDKPKQDLSTSRYMSSGFLKSPIKRRGDSLTDVSDIGELERCLRSSSDGALNELLAGHSSIKRSKVSRAQSDVLIEELVNMSSTPRIKTPSNCRFGTKTSPRKIRQQQAALRLKLDEEIEDTDCSRIDNYDAALPDVVTMKDELKFQEQSKFIDSHSKFSETDDEPISWTDISKNGQRPKCGRSSVIVSNRSGSATTWEDSDSDTEDFLNIVAESGKAFTFTESTLQKFCQEHTEGVIRDPAEFMGPLATCQTNINCMLELVDALQSGTQIREAESKVQQINNIVSRWRELEMNTVHHQQQCRLLFILYTERIRCEKQLSAMLKDISVDRFDDLQGLENTCRAIQAVSTELQTKLEHQLKLLGNKIQQFQNSHATVDASRFVTSVEKLQQTADSLLDLCSRKESYLKKSLMTWYQLAELQCHLEYVISHEEHQIDCLDVATDVVRLSASDFQDTAEDLKVMRDSWSIHSDKLQLMESLMADLKDVCTARGHRELDAAINQFSNRLSSLRLKCDQMIERMMNSSMDAEDNGIYGENLEHCDDMKKADELTTNQGEEETSCTSKSESNMEIVSQGEERIDTQSFETSFATSPDEEMSKEEPKIETCFTASHDDIILAEQIKCHLVDTIPALKNEVAGRKTSSSRALYRLLKYALPLPLLLMLIFGGLYLLSDDWFGHLSYCGLDLRYVNAAPPS